MKSIAITGTIGSGKSIVMSLLSKDYPTIDCDVIAHKLLEENQAGYNAVLHAFHELFSNQPFSHKLLADHVFNNNKALRKLEAILHPMVLNEVQRLLHLYQDKTYVFVEVPLLFEVSWQEYFDLSVVVYTKKENIYRRLSVNRNMTKDDVDKRLKRQFSSLKKRRLADYVIDNNDSLEVLTTNINEFIKWLKHTA
ncbi:MAG: dephospho-CoA kinase [Erysipelotrichaceae bacterium]|nr:dephospho-CoA kinase [Erysipelotrichaceae bacterium]